MIRTYTVKEAAKILNYSTNSIYTFLKTNHIKAIRVGKGRFRIPSKELKRFLPEGKAELKPAYAGRGGFARKRGVGIFLATLSTLGLVFFHPGELLWQMYHHDLAANGEVTNVIRQSVYFLDAYKLAGSKAGDKVVGTVILKDGSFSAYRILDADVAMPDGENPAFQGEVNIEFFSKNVVRQVIERDLIDPFYLKDGTKTIAVSSDFMITQLVGAKGQKIPIKILKGQVKNGRLVGTFLATAYTTGHILAGAVNDQGDIQSVIVSSGLSRMTEAQVMLGPAALSFFDVSPEKNLSAGEPDVLAAETYGRGGSVLFDPARGVWRVNEGPSFSSAGNVATFLQKVTGSAQATQFFSSEQQSTVVSSPQQVITYQGLNDIKSNVPNLKVSTTDGVATISIDWSGISSAYDALNKSGNKDVLTSEMIKGGVVTSDKIADGTIVNVDISDSAAIADSKLAQLTTSNKVAGSAIQLSTGGGLVNATGLSLLRTCSTDQILSWNGTSWVCATQSGGASAGVSSLNALTGALTVAGGGINSISASGTTVTVTGTEADTLSTVVGRGASTSTGITLSSATPLTLSSTSPSISMGNTGTLSITDGTNTLLSLVDNGTTGTLTVNALTVSGLSNGILKSASGVISTVAAPTGTLVGDTDTQTLTNKTISGSSNTLSNIGNSSLTNSSVTVTGTSGLTGGGAVALGASTSLSLDTTAANTWTGLTTFSSGTLNSGARVGKALGIFNETGDQNILAASASGTTKLTVDRSGNVVASGTINGLAITNNGTNTLTIAAGKTLTVNNSLTFVGTDGNILTFPSGNDTVVTLTGTQTLTNKTLTSPIISAISNTGTITLPTATTTLVGRDTTDTLTNKTISGSSNTLSNIGNSSLTNSSVTINSAGIISGGGLVSLGGTLTLTGTEADTLSSVVSRGATTTTLVNLNGGVFSQGAVSGKALVRLDETGDQNVLSASASGTTIFQLQRTGNLVASGTLTGLTGLTVASGTVSLPSASIANAALANSSVTVTAGTGLTGGGAVSLGSGVTINAAQNITTSSSPTFAGLTLTNTANQLVFGTTNTTTITSTAPSTSRTYTLPDFGSNDTLVGLAATQTLTNKTIAASSNTISGLTNTNLSGTAGISNANLANSTIGITAGTGLTGGGTPALGGSTSLSLDTTAANAWTGLQTFSSGIVGSGFRVGKAYLTLNETGDQNVLSASASGTTIFQLQRTGNLVASGTLTGLTGLTVSSGNVDQSGSSGTWQTGTGAVSLNGTTTLAASKPLIITGGAGNPTATTGTVWYDTTANKFKIVENGVVKTVCNTTDAGCGAGGSSALSGLTAATGANTIASGDNAQVWQWALTTAAKTAFTFGESAASINGAGSQYVLGVSTLASSTAAPFTISARGNTIIDTTSTGGITIGNATAAQAVTVDAGTATLNIGNSNNAKTINIGTGTAIDTINIGTGGTGTDLIAIGSSANAWNITSGGNITTSGTIAQTYSTGAAGNAHTLAITNSNTGAGVTIGGLDITPTNTAAPLSGTNVLNILSFEAGGALGANGNTHGINFLSATGYTNFLKSPSIVISSAGAITGATGITSATGDVAITAGNLSLNGVQRISNAGVGTFVTGTVIGSQTFTTNNITDSGALTINSNGANPLTLDSGTTGNVLIGNNANGKAITIGNSTANTSLTFTAGGTGSQTFNSSVSTGNGASSGFIYVANSLGTTGTAIQVSSSTTTLTTAGTTVGSILNLAGVTYAHTASEVGNVASIAFTDSTTNAGASLNTTTTGLNITSTVNVVTGTGTGTKQIEGINIAAPTLTACTGGGGQTCEWDGMELSTQSTGAAAAITQNGLNIVAAGISAGTLNGIKIGALTAGAGTETAINIGSGWDNLISGTIAGTNLLSFTNFTVSSAGAITGVGVNSGIGLLQGTGGLTITGAAVSLNASSNFATNINTGTSTGTVTIGGTGVMTIAIGNGGTGAKTINIGDGASTGATDIESGTGNLSLGISNAARTIVIGTATAGTAQTVNINNTATAGIVNVGAGMTTGTITVGGTSQTGTITLGQSTGSQTVNILNTVTAAGATKTINIGAGQNASTGITAINIGLNNTSTGVNTVTIKAGGSGASLGPSMTLGSVASTTAVCSSLALATAPTAGTAYAIRDCSGAPAADYAEIYPVSSDVEYGDIVTTGTEMVNTYDQKDGGPDWSRVKGQVTRLIKSNKSYQATIIGIVSENHGDFSSTGYNIKDSDSPKPVALSGRVPVKIAPDSEAIQPGDFLTTSTTPGRAMKATQAGEVIGKALDTWDSNSGKDQIIVFIEQGYYNGLSNTAISGLTGNATQLAQFIDVVSSKITTDELVATKIKTSQIEGLKEYVLGVATESGIVSSPKNIFASLVEFLQTVIFHKDVSFLGRPTFNSDTAGFAIIKSAATEVHIVFDKEYNQKPIVVASPDQPILFAITNVDTKGFIIKLGGVQSKDTNFSWHATAVKDAKTAISEPTPTLTPTPSTSAITPTVPSASTVTATPSITPIALPTPSTQGVASPSAQTTSIPSVTSGPEPSASPSASSSP